MLQGRKDGGLIGDLTLGENALHDCSGWGKGLFKNQQVEGNRGGV